MTPSVQALECYSCGRSSPFHISLYTCPACDGNLFFTYVYKEIASRFDATLRQSSLMSEPPLLRYAALLPNLDRASMRLYVGATPLYAADQHQGCTLYFKDDSRNPSGSFKDRATAVVIGCALAHGFKKIAVASTGNAASSLACLGASAGLDVTIFVPSTITAEKLVQMQLFGATVHQIDGSYDDAYEHCQAFCAADPSYLNRNTGYNPVTREGKKTCAFEIWEQLGRNVPDWVTVSVGDGNILSGLWKGFQELTYLGLASRTPQMLAVQSDASDAVVRLVHQGDEAAVAAPKAGGIAESIRVGRPRDAVAAVRAIHESQGRAVTVTDTDMLEAVRVLALQWGLFVEPAAAASYAAVKQLERDGILKPTDTVVSVLTGTGLKDIQSAKQALAMTSIH